MLPGITRNFPSLCELNQLPFPINIKRLDDGPGITKTLKNHNAIHYLNKCCSLFTNTEGQKE